RLRRPEAGRRGGLAGADDHDNRRRRSWSHGSDTSQGAGRQGGCRRRYRPAKACGGASRRRPRCHRRQRFRCGAATKVRRRWVQHGKAAADGSIAAVIDFVGASATAQFGIDALARGGKYVIVGLFGGDITLSLPLLPMRAITVQGSYVGSLAEMRELLALVATGSAPPVPVSERRLDQVNAVLEELKGGRVVGRAVLTP